MEKACINCDQKFKIYSEDLDFYSKISPTFGDKTYKIPPPKHCPDCRQQRRLTFRNERTLYKRHCDLTGKNIISLYSPDNPQPIYETATWWGDSWDPKKYGRDFDFTRPFFDQFKELLREVPEISLMNDEGRTSENCAYTNDFAFSRNCYLCFVTWHNEDCYYSTGIHYSRNTVDSIDTIHSELCYECIDCEKCYKCAFLQYSEDCTDCYFGYDLKNCKNCFKCSGLRNKQYHIENKSYSKEEYKKLLKEAYTSSHSGLKKAKFEYAKFIETIPHRNVFNLNCENCQGNKLKGCKNVWGFESYDCQDSRYIYHCPGVKDCFDTTNTGKGELCYETLVSNESYFSLFTNECWNTNNSFYSNHCFNCDYIFGCSGLKKQRYCILNKQYSEEEYFELVPRIIEHMKKTEEWGEFFPHHISPFGYNETTAQEYFPLSKQEVLEKGWKWHEPIKKEGATPKAQISNVADNIIDIDTEILKKTLIDQKSKKEYKIIPSEFQFYRKMNLPIPRVDPEKRHLNRLMQRYPRKLFLRKCDNCNSKIHAGYSKKSPQIVYCEKCYLEKVY